MSNKYCIITAGGAGTRFWPFSRKTKPKQFLTINENGKSLLQLTYDRIKNIIPVENIIIVTAARYHDLVKEQIPQINEENLLLEPYSRNTAPCLTYANYNLLKRDPQAQVIVSPSDQVVRNDEMFQAAVHKAFNFLSDHDVLMTLGIPPSRPDTNYGYIQSTAGKDSCLNGDPAKVKTFTEKPDKTLAEVFMKTGEFFWNSGIFVWKASTFIKEVEKYLPEVTQLFCGWENVLGTKLEPEFIQRAFTDCINVPVDFAVMSKTDKAWVFPVKFEWNDIGNWCSIYAHESDKDQFNNLINTNDKLVDKSHDNMVISHKKDKLIAIKGLDNYMVLDTEDALVICPKDEKEFKEFISNIAMPKFEKYR